MEAELRPNWGMFHSEAHGRKMAEKHAGHGSFMLLELKGDVWRMGGGAGKAGRSGWIEEGLACQGPGACTRMLDREWWDPM